MAEPYRFLLSRVHGAAASNRLRNGSHRGRQTTARESAVRSSEQAGAGAGRGRQAGNAAAAAAAGALQALRVQTPAEASEQAAIVKALSGQCRRGQPRPCQRKQECCSVQSSAVAPQTRQARWRVRLGLGLPWLRWAAAEAEARASGGASQQCCFLDLQLGLSVPLLAGVCSVSLRCSSLLGAAGDAARRRWDCCHWSTTPGRASRHLLLPGMRKPIMPEARETRLRSLDS
ncbi:hypothetical protein AXG93_773s1570 [Marchantia polymorpha subsp. ruderalis]|uniref:Uncharacterized protein n=1 Tax=Marchantia polymorpha subsp. ruderalis TaxID=1480154 RepID=A0A176WA03_MARPO|nr:hypothetical protein AXG93_773s1570 [Marchantia polymorpha subsp. ruderalis]